MAAQVISASRAGLGSVVVSVPRGFIAGVGVVAGPPDQPAIGLLYTDPDGFYTHSVVAIGPSQALLPGAIADADAVYGPSIGSDLQTLLPGLVADVEAFHAPTIVGVGATRTLLPALVADADAIYAPAAIQGRFLRPALITDAEAVYPAFDIDTAKPPKEQTLRPGRLNSDDVIFSPRFSLSPQLVVAADVIYAPILIWENPVRPPMLASDDAIPAAAISPKLPSSFIPADDAIYRPGISLFLVPVLLADDDAIPAADVGWQVIAEFVGNDDAVYAAQEVKSLNDLWPDIWLDEEHIDTYPFFVQSVTGGIPVPRPPGILTGSLGSKPRLTGSIARPPRLTGSIGNATRRTGTGK